MNIITSRIHSSCRCYPAHSYSVSQGIVIALLSLHRSPSKETDVFNYHRGAFLMQSRKINNSLSKHRSSRHNHAHENRRRTGCRCSRIFHRCRCSFNGGWKR